MKHPLFKHIDDVQWTAALPQVRDGRSLAIHLKVLDRSEGRLVSYTRYDPGYVVPLHSHGGDEVIYILDGDVTIGDVHCTPGMAIMLNKGTPIGPIVAGSQGTRLLEVFIGKDAGKPIFAADATDRRPQ